MCDKKTALYLFCFARPGLPPAMPGTGIDGQSPVLVHAFPAASAVLSEVALDEFCGPAAEEKLKDLAWLGPRACRHEQVIEKVMESSPVLPASFATLFSTPSTLRGFAESRAQTISQFLDLVADRQEWAVRGMADLASLRQAAVSREMAARAAQLTSLSPGNRYLQEKKIRTAAQTTVRGWVEDVCQELSQELGEHAVAFAERQVWDAGEELKSVVNWAFLLPKSNVAAFRERLELANHCHQPSGLTFKLSGPWPPYSFAPSLSTGSLA